jgi:hypothetical protein
VQSCARTPGVIIGTRLYPLEDHKQKRSLTSTHASAWLRALQAAEEAEAVVEERWKQKLAALEVSSQRPTLRCSDAQRLQTLRASPLNLRAYFACKGIAWCRVPCSREGRSGRDLE